MGKSLRLLIYDISTEENREWKEKRREYGFRPILELIIPNIGKFFGRKLKRNKWKARVNTRNTNGENREDAEGFGLKVQEREGSERSWEIERQQIDREVLEKGEIERGERECTAKRATERWEMQLEMRERGCRMKRSLLLEVPLTPCPYRWHHRQFSTWCLSSCQTERENTRIARAREPACEKCGEC